MTTILKVYFSATMASWLLTNQLVADTATWIDKQNDILYRPMPKRDGVHLSTSIPIFEM